LLGEGRGGKYVGENSKSFGRTHSEETKKLFSQLRTGDKNPLFGKLHSNETKLLMSKAKKGKPLDVKTREAISKANGITVYIYVEVDKNCILNNTFFSYRKAAKFLNTSKNTVSRYIKSGLIFQNKYKLSDKLL
jgi:group I intron endonuclease